VEYETGRSGAAKSFYLQPMGSGETCKFEYNMLFVAAWLQRRILAMRRAVAALLGGGKSREIARVERRKNISICISIMNTVIIRRPCSCVRLDAIACDKRR
jgi:hypothetical protein